MKYNKLTEIELRKQAIKFDSEFINWVGPFRVWLLVLVVIQLVSFIFAWVGVGGICVGLFMIWAVHNAVKIKEKNIENNSKEIKEVENAK